MLNLDMPPSRCRGPTILGQRGHERATELDISGRDGTARNAVDRLARIYTPAVGGSIPSAPTSIDWRQSHIGSGCSLRLFLL